MKLSKGFKYSLVVIFFIALAFFVYNFFSIKLDHYNNLKKEYSVLKKKSEKQMLELAGLKEKTLKDNKVKDQKIKVLREELVRVDRQKERLARKDEEKDLKIRKLVEERRRLQEPKEIIINLETQVKEWEERFWNERADKEESEKAARKWAAIADLNLRKYLNEKTLREAVEKKLDDEILLRKAAEEISKEGEKIIRSMSFKLNLKNALCSIGGFVFGVIVG